MKDTFDSLAESNKDKATFIFVDVDEIDDV